MAEEPTRKLAVLLHADVVGSTALVQLDETLAHQRIQETFRRFSETITNHDGVAREVRGDALVAEFARASDAVSASLSFQATNAAHNEELPDDVRPVVRVGIAMGEVVVADNTVTGEGIVLAQRLEQLAEPGCVCIQGAAYETVPKRLPFEYENLGEQNLKGFNEAIRVYAVKNRIDNSEAHLDMSMPRSTSDKPAIVILPFTNRSSDPEQEYFSDGLTEDVITALSRYRDLLVTAPGSSWLFKGKSENATNVAKQLGVEYVVEGSVRRSGEKVRVTVQVVDGTTGARLWAEAYDRSLTDIFEVQDDVTRSIVCTLTGQVEEAHRKAALRKSNTDLTAYDLVLRARSYFRDWKGTEQDIRKARTLYEEAIKQDAECARAYTGLAETYIAEYMSPWSVEKELAGENALEFAQKAVALDTLDSNAHAVLSHSYKHIDSNYDRALSEITKAITLNPNDYWSYCAKSEMCIVSGDLDEGIASANEAIRRNPLLPDSCLLSMGFANYLAGRYETAINNFRSLLQPYSESEAYVAASYAQLGRTAEAQAAAANFRKLHSAERLIDSESEAEGWQKFWRRDWAARDLKLLDSMLDGLRKAKIVTEPPE